MPKEVGIALFVLLAVVLLGLMALSWQRRKRRQVGIGTPAAVPNDVGASIGAFSGLYLATTLADQRLHRVAIRPFGFRAEGTIVVAEHGLVVSLVGSDPWFIPKSDVLGARRASWTIDRGVEEDGLNLVSWRLASSKGTTALDSYFRLRDPQGFDTAIATTAIATIAPVTTTEGTTA